MEIRFPSGKRIGLRSVSLTIVVLSFVLAGGCTIATRQDNHLVLENNARFLHAFQDANQALARNDFEKAGHIARMWQKYPSLTTRNRKRLLELVRKIRREQALYLMGEARQLEAVGHLNEALGKVDLASTLDPSWQAPRRARRHLLILVDVQGQMGRQWESLVRRLLVLRKSDPSNPELDRTLAWSYFHLARSRFSSDHFAGAYRWVKKSLLLDPENSDARELEGRILKKVNADTDQGEALFRTNHIDQSIALFHRALRIRPDDPRARKDLELALEAQALGGRSGHTGDQTKSVPPPPRL